MRDKRSKCRLGYPAAEIIKNSGQVLIEYILMFTVIVIVIIFAATHYIQPSVNHLFEETGDAINHIADDFVSGVYTW